MLQLEMAMNELSYLPEGEYRVLKFEHDIFSILQSLSTGRLQETQVPLSEDIYKMYLRDNKIEIDLM